MNGRVTGVFIAFVCLIGTVSPTAAAARPSSSAALMSVRPDELSGLAPDVLDLAMGAVTCAVSAGALAPPHTLTVIDYSLPSTAQRLWVFEVPTGRLLFHELVAHGKNTGDNMATRFSDTMQSRQSSLGLFVTRDTYVGNNGYSLRLDGLEPGFNGRALERAIVMHGAPYVDAGVAKQMGRLGRSWGCPALRTAIARKVIDTVRDGGAIFSYYPDEAWLTRSAFLNCGSTKDTKRSKDTKKNSLS